MNKEKLVFNNTSLGYDGLYFVTDNKLYTTDLEQTCIIYDIGMEDGIYDLFNAKKSPDDVLQPVFKYLPTSEFFTVDAKYFERIIKELLVCASKNSLRPGMCAIRLEEGKGFIATNGSMLKWIKSHIPTFSASIPSINYSKLFALINMFKTNVIHVGLAEDWLVINNSRWEYRVRLVDHPYPNFEAVVPKTYEYRIDLPLNFEKTLADFVKTSKAVKLTRIFISINNEKLNLIARDWDLNKEIVQTHNCGINKFEKPITLLDSSDVTILCKVMDDKGYLVVLDGNLLIKHKDYKHFYFRIDKNIVRII